MSAGPLRVRYLDFASMPEIFSDLGDMTLKPKVAYSIGKRFGNAVERNRARRRIDAAFSEVWNRSAHMPGFFLIGARRSLLVAPYKDVVSWVDRCVSGLASDTSPELQEA